MSRPKCCRNVNVRPVCRRFRPEGAGDVPVVRLELEELEALRLADSAGLHHQQAAERMGVSRATFGRIVSRARKVVADALLTGSALQLGELSSCCRPGRDGGCRRRRRCGPDERSSHESAGTGDS